MKATDTRHDAPSSSTLRAVLRIVLLAVAALFWLVLSAPPILIASLFGERARFRVIVALTGPFCRTIAAIVGLRINLQGERRKDVVIFVANHVSWLDILVLGSTVSGVFVSRHDVKDWPAIGIFARLAGTVFIDRSSLRSAVESSATIVTRAAAGIRVSFFPEGVASDGTDVLPFKPFLFGAIVEHGLAVQPLTIRFPRMGTTPVSPENRDIIYWHLPDQNILSHGWEVLKLRNVKATATFRDPVTPPDEAGREELRTFVRELRDRTAQGIPVWGE